MRVEGECAQCGATLGVQIGDSVAVMVGSAVERMMDNEGNGIYCPKCGEYVRMTNIEIIEDH